MPVVHAFAEISAGEVLIAPDRCTPYRASFVAPVVPPPTKVRHLLGIWAHPDDEAYLSAALMARTIDAGGQVTLVSVTNGEGGFPDDDVRPMAELAAQRQRELTRAMAHIGVRDVRFLHMADGAVAQDSDDRLSGTIRDLLREIHPDLVVTFGPDGITGHEDHVSTSKAVTGAWADTGIGDLWYAAQTRAWLDEWRDTHDDLGIWMTEEPMGIDPGDAVAILDLAGDELDRKRSVLGEHRSQTVQIAAALGEDTYRRWVRQETFRRPSPADLTTASATGNHRALSGTVR